MKKYWQSMWNCESKDGTWEIINDDETKTVKLEFWDYTNQGTSEELLNKKVELVLTFEQYQSLLDFSEKMNKRIWDSIKM